MYIGDTRDGSGLNNMVRELVSNAIAEVLAGFADRIEVVLNPDGSCRVCDNGRGIPVDIHESAGVSAAEVIMTRLAPYQRFSASAVVVNALSDWLELRIWRMGHEYAMRFGLGRPEASLAATGMAQNSDGKPRQGTEITFSPSAKFFAPVVFDFAALEAGLRRLVLANAGVSLVLPDRRDTEERAVLLTSGTGTA